MKKLIIIGLVVLLGVGGFFYFKPEAEITPVETLSTIPVTVGPIKQTIFTNGVIESNETTNVYAQTSANLTSVFVTVGDQVKAGDVIALLDTTDLEKSLKSAEYQYAQDKASLEALETTGNTTTTASYQNALNTYNDAKASYESNSSLYEAGIITQEALNTSKSSMDNAYYSYLSAKDKLNTSNVGNEIERLTLKLNIDQMEIDSIKADIQAASIVAPTSGTVVSDIEDINKKVSSGELLFSIENLNDLVVHASVSEYEISEIEIGQSVTIEILGDDTLYNGKVSHISPKADVSSDVTIPVTIEIDNEDSNLKPNFTANIEITIDFKKEALSVPYEALLDSPKGTFLLVLRGEEQVMVDVEKGITSDLYVEVISNDLASDDQIVVTSAAAAATQGQMGIMIPGMGGVREGGQPGKRPGN